MKTMLGFFDGLWLEEQAGARLSKNTRKKNPKGGPKKWTAKAAIVCTDSAKDTLAKTNTVWFSVSLFVQVWGPNYWMDPSQIWHRPSPVGTLKEFFKGWPQGRNEKKNKNEMISVIPKKNHIKPILIVCGEAKTMEQSMLLLLGFRRYFEIQKSSQFWKTYETKVVEHGEIWHYMRIFRTMWPEFLSKIAKNIWRFYKFLRFLPIWLPKRRQNLNLT